MMSRCEGLIPSEDEVVGRLRTLNELDKEVTEDIRKMETRELRLR